MDLKIIQKIINFNTNLKNWFKINIYSRLRASFKLKNKIINPKHQHRNDFRFCF